MYICMCVFVFILAQDIHTIEGRSLSLSLYTHTHARALRTSTRLRAGLFYIFIHYTLFNLQYRIVQYVSLDAYIRCIYHIH
jgi:hypothetical protein